MEENSPPHTLYRHGPPGLSPGLSPGLDQVDETADLLVDLLALHHHGGDFGDRMNDGGVIAPTELRTNRGVRVVGELPAEVHGDLAGGGEGSATAGTAELVGTKTEGLRGGLDYGGRGDRL